jgi:hypothetical protein
MKSRWIKLKNASQKLFSTLKRHQITIYYTLLALLLSFSFIVIQDIRHTKEILKLQNEKAALLFELEDVSELAFDQLEVMKNQVLLVNKYEITIEAAKEALGDQSRLINDLVNYLKGIGHWPPKKPRPPEVDKGKWAISKGEI